MSESKTYQLSHHFSKLGNLQNEKTITYAVFDQNGGSTIVLKEITPKRTYTESCFLPKTDFAYAKKIATLLCENCIEISSWKETLEDIGINYSLTESGTSA